MAAIRTYMRQLFKVVAERGYWLRPLGQLDDYIMWLVRTRNIYSYDHTDPKVLIIAGFHGEEVGGPWSILKWLKEADSKVFEKYDISLIPIVNSYGFARNKRYGSSGMKTNAGFVHTGQEHETAKDDVLSPEGEILTRNIDILRPLAQDGVLSMHEDNTCKEYYLYAYEHGKKPGKFTKKLLKELSKFFRKPYNGIAFVEPSNTGFGPPCVNGLVYNFRDTTFEDWMFHLGVPKVAVIETPGKYKLKRRVEAGGAMIQKFLSLVKNGA